MLLEYVQAALRHAKYEILTGEGTYYGEIPQCRGVHAHAASLEDCREQLREVLEEMDPLLSPPQSAPSGH